MRSTSPVTVFFASASGVLADTGAHLHPHGSEVWFAVLGATAALFLAGLIRKVAARIAARTRARK